MKSLLIFLFIFCFSLIASATTWEVNAQNTSASTSGSTYDNNTNITTTLNIPNAQALKITISGETESGYDFLYITREDSIVKSFDGTLNEIYIVEASSITLQFISGYSETKSGVTISIEEYSGTIYNSETIYNSGTIPFNLINPSETQNIIGDTQIIGNTVECVTTTKYASSSDYSSLTCDNTIGDYNNNNYTVKYLDIDGDSNTFNSSSATIEFPSTFKEIAWVGLYWQAHINNDSWIYLKNNNNKLKSSDYPSGGIEATTANSVKLKIADGTYADINASQVSYFNSSSYARYSAFADITSYFDASYTAGSSTIITVANILASQGIEYGLGNYGAWSLVVIYKEDPENSLSKLRNNSVYLGYQYVSSSSGERDIILNDFLLPKNGTIDSQMAVFAAEGEYRYEPDTMELDGTALGNPDKTNVFDARLSSSITRNPNMTNNNGIDIDVFDTSEIMTAKRDANPNATTYSSTITLDSDSDLYYPSMVSFTTELYKPRVCYIIDTIEDSNKNIIFENKKFTSEINAGEDYTFTFGISNMKKDASDTDLEIANLVQVYLETTNLNYKSASTSMNNMDGTNFSVDRNWQNITDTDEVNVSGVMQKDDLGERVSRTSTWRVGVGATKSAGGTLPVSNGFTDTKNITYTKLTASLVITDQENIDLLDYLSFKASFQTDTITIGQDNAQEIVQCQDLNSSVGVGAPPAGAFNVVQTIFNTSSSDPLDPAAIENRLPTQVSGRNFTVRVLSLDNTYYTELTDYNGDVNVSIIPTPTYTGDEITDAILCEAAIPLTATTSTLTFNNESFKDFTVPNTTQALQNASFKVTYTSSGISKSTCSRDVFAIRPQKFLLIPSPIDDIELLHSGEIYYMTLKAVVNSTLTPTNNYNVSNVDSTVFTISDQKYAPDGSIDDTLNGNFTFVPNGPFNILNGISDNSGITQVVTMSFDDVGLVNLNIQDQSWSKVDIDNSDTPLDCTENGAFICGDINATFIPHYFALTNSTLNNAGASTYTYISSDLNISAGITLTVEARNKSNGVTTNFKSGSWENPVDIAFVLPVVTGMSENKSEITTTQNLGFATGQRVINSTDTNTSANLIFNYNRTINTPANPFKVTGANVTLTATSTYTSSSGTTANITSTGVINPIQDATFIYGRTHTPRQRFTGNTGTALIYYEAYCSGTINGNTCNKALLPNGTNSNSTDDPRWFINTNHIATSGNTGSINQKRGNDVSAATPTGIAPANVALTYDNATSKGYPFKTTMENNASSWLIYNKYNPAATTNEFQVEFINANSTWAGTHETDAMTNKKASNTTNRRSMW